ncbi:hypothetical protein JAAARDRAFT_461754 [Jaapia argillacea MUCL 33604]|uniref:Zinc-finger domain-containing protein n=1 Tax=Jaapia argillacea MUCL 33604 TaxID=933084 RepID=A0A067Q623_9AGAM|nr:hypothetical protein JAAARDRAFT_461754 [Jaapia argillacea MUCL 33604]
MQQLQNQQHLDDTTDFFRYRSVFAKYPMLRSYSHTPYQTHRPSSSASSSTSISSSCPSNPPSPTLVPSAPLFRAPYEIPDLKPLKLLTATKAMFSMPGWADKRICQFEVPGGGECRDAGCEDIHLSHLVDAGAEPSGECIHFMECWLAYGGTSLPSRAAWLLWSSPFCL